MHPPPHTFVSIWTPRSLYHSQPQKYHPIYRLFRLSTYFSVFMNGTQSLCKRDLRAASDYGGWEESLGSIFCGIVAEIFCEPRFPLPNCLQIRSICFYFTD